MLNFTSEGTVVESNVKREQGTSAIAGIKVFFLNLFVLLSAIATAYALLF